MGSNKQKKIAPTDLLPLIAAASAARKIEILKKLLKESKAKRIPYLKIYETLLQNYLFTGYPSALESLKLLHKYFPVEKLKKPADMNLYHFRKRGEINCKKVYGRKYIKLLTNISTFSPDLAEWLVLEGYGKVFGRGRISFKERELNIVAVLTVLKFEDQLYSHVNGAIRAKASPVEIKILIEKITSKRITKSPNFGLKVLNRYLKEKGMEI